MCTQIKVKTSIAYVNGVAYVNIDVSCANGASINSKNKTHKTITKQNRQPRCLVSILSIVEIKEIEYKITKKYL